VWGQQSSMIEGIFLCDVLKVIEPPIMCYSLGYGVKELFSDVLVWTSSLKLGIKFSHE
jgi:hypothetical protein